MQMDTKFTAEFINKQRSLREKSMYSSFNRYNIGSEIKHARGGSEYILAAVSNYVDALNEIEKLKAIIVELQKGTTDVMIDIK